MVAWTFSWCVVSHCIAGYVANVLMTSKLFGAFGLEGGLTKRSKCKLSLLSRTDLNGADIERDVTDWWKSSYRLSKSLEDEFPAAAQCAARLREDTTAFQEHLPVIQVPQHLISQW